MSSPLDYLGNVTANTRAKAARVLAATEASWFHPTHFWGYDPNPGNPEHHSRTAIDFMVFGNTKAGDVIAEYLWENREALGLKHLIWKQRIRSTVNQPGVWRPMADRGSPTENHMDHVHAWFLDTPIRDKAPASSIPNLPKPTKPKPAPKPTASVPAFPGLVRRGSKGAAVRKVQQRLKDRGWRITVDGDFGPGTEAIVRAFQSEKRLTVDGVVGKNTWRALWTATVTK